MQYEVRITPQAAAQIQETAAYVSQSLFAPEAAKHWVSLLQKHISALSSMPARYPLVDEEPWKSYGIRKMTVKNFLIYYFVDKENKTVSITAVVYGRRDQLSALSELIQD